MSAFPRFALQLTVIGVLTGVGLPAVAQETSRALAAAEDNSESKYYQPAMYQPVPRAIVQERAFVRANQRQARLASLAWYGMYNGRPTAASTPFTSMYSPVWQQPGGRPFAWYASSRTTYVYYR